MTCLSNKQIRAAPSSDKPVEEVNTLFELYGVHFKSGTVFDLDRFGDDDLADGVRVWDATHGVVDFPCEGSARCNVVGANVLRFGTDSIRIPNQC